VRHTLFTTAVYDFQHGSVWLGCTLKHSAIVFRSLLAIDGTEEQQEQGQQEQQQQQQDYTESHPSFVERISGTTRSTTTGKWSL